MDKNRLQNGFCVELAIDEEGPKKLLITEHDGRFTVAHDDKILATVKHSSDNDWVQVDGHTLSPGAVALIGEAIIRQTN